jgi:hypothetical protein
MILKKCKVGCPKRGRKKAVELPQTDKQQLKQAIVFLNRALMCGGSTRSWMEDVTTFVREVEKQRHCV